MIGYISLTRDNGQRALMRSDEIAAIAENTTKVDQKVVPCTTVLLRNNVAWHFPEVTPDQLIAMMKGVCGEQITVLDKAGAGI